MDTVGVRSDIARDIVFQDFLQLLEEAWPDPSDESLRIIARGLQGNETAQTAAITVLHEYLGHDALKIAPLVRIQSQLMKQVWAGIYDLCLDGAGTGDDISHIVSLPLTGDYAVPGLPRILALLTDLHRITSAVQEVTSVWVSLDMAVDQGVLTADQRSARARAACNAYQFTDLYEEFDRLASLVGPNVIRPIALFALRTLTPEAALRDVLRGSVPYFAELRRPRDNDEMHTLVARLLDGFTSSNYADRAEPRIRPLQPFIERLMHQMAGEGEAGGSEGRVWSLDSQAVTYNSEGFLATVPDNIAYTAFMESLRQQLTRGRGLQCPFWTRGRSCCGRRFLLEGLLKATVPGPNCSWRRNGCLLRGGW
jgi:hypothetical protein